MKNLTYLLAWTMILMVLTAIQSHAQSAYEPYTFTTLAGVSRGSDGTGSTARFYYPRGVAVDNVGNVYVAEQYNQTIRKVSPAGAVTTLAGLAGSWGRTDGTGSAARFWGPSGVAVDSAGNVYVADLGNQTIRKVTPEGAVTTLAGLVQLDDYGFHVGGSADGTGSAARFNFNIPEYEVFGAGVAVDSAGNVYVADAGNGTIRKGYPGNAHAVIVTSGPGLGFNPDGSGFGFNLTGPTGHSVVVETSTNLLNWLPIWTNTFAGALHFRDPRSGISSKRFYRARLP